MSDQGGVNEDVIFGSGRARGRSTILIAGMFCFVRGLAIYSCRDRKAEIASLLRKNMQSLEVKQSMLYCTSTAVKANLASASHLLHLESGHVYSISSYPTATLL